MLLLSAQDMHVRIVGTLYMYVTGVVTGCLTSTEAAWRAVQYFDANSVECYILALPTVEANKGFDLVFEVARHLEKFALNRYSPHPHNV